MTDAGEELCQRIGPHVDAIQRQLLKRLNAAERKELIYLISKAMGVDNAQFDGKLKLRKS